jgi:hypothetical protein
MTSFASRIGTGAVAIVLASAPLAGHHYGLSAFDGSKPLRISGVLVTVEWTNPHAKFHVDVRTADGAVERWIAETGSPGTLTRLGLDRSRLRPGEPVSLSGFPARDGTRWMIVRSLTLSGGAAVDLSQQG